MPPTAWEFFNNFKRALGAGEIDLTGTGTSFRMYLYNSQSNIETVTASTRASISSEVSTEGGGSFNGGRAITVEGWSVKTTTSTFSWNINDVVFTASGSDATNVKFALICTAATSVPVCYSRLTTAAFTVTDGATLTISPTNNVFELS